MLAVLYSSQIFKLKLVLNYLSHRLFSLLRIVVFHDGHHLLELSFLSLVGRLEIPYLFLNLVDHHAAVV